MQLINRGASFPSFIMSRFTIEEKDGINTYFLFNPIIFSHVFEGELLFFQNVNHDTINIILINTNSPILKPVLAGQQSQSRLMANITDANFMTAIRKLPGVQLLYLKEIKTSFDSYIVTHN